MVQQMGFLVCSGCKGYYKLKPGESPNDFDDHCECGGRLLYEDSIPTNSIKDRRDVISHGYSYTDKKSFNFKLVIVFGVVLILVGLICSCGRNRTAPQVVGTSESP